MGNTHSKGQKSRSLLSRLRSPRRATEHDVNEGNGDSRNPQCPANHVTASNQQAAGDDVPAGEAAGGPPAPSGEASDLVGSVEIPSDNGDLMATAGRVARDRRLAARAAVPLRRASEAGSGSAIETVENGSPYYLDGTAVESTSSVELPPIGVPRGRGIVGTLPFTTHHDLRIQIDGTIPASLSSQDLDSPSSTDAGSELGEHVGVFREEADESEATEENVPENEGAAHDSTDEVISSVEDGSEENAASPEEASQ